MKTLTIVSPAYNEAESIHGFYDVLSKELAQIEGYDSSILFVVDGGTDTTFRILSEIAGNDPKVGVLKLSTNFGHQMALLAGIDHVHSDVVIMMDSDLQHPPSVIPLLLKKYEEGNEIVYTIRSYNEKVGIVRGAAGTLFYWFINIISDVPINPNASDFRLISGRVAAIIRDQIRERNLFLRGIISWMGFSQAAVSFKANTRFAGKSKYSFSRLVQFATFGIISFSKKPLRAASIVGISVAIFGAIFGVVTAIQYFLGDVTQPGYPTIIVLLTMFGGLQLFFFGVIGEYIGAIFDEVKGRPHYLIEKVVGNAQVVTK